MEERELRHLGVLFVHGIGDQARGSTLVDFGTPLVDWLDDRTDGGAGLGKAEIVPEGGDPASVELVVGPAETRQRWLMAESWWAGSFAAPPFADLARWGFAVAPWTFGSHYGERLRAAWRKRVSGWRRLTKPLAVAAAFLSLLAALAMSMGVIVALVVLLWVSLIPLQRLRDAISTVQLRIAAFLGDSYVVVARRIEFAAILSKVRHDLNWLAERCARIAVVAHSQGAAMACHVVARDPGKTGLLLTFGSGLRKLEQQRGLRARPQFVRGGTFTIAGFLLTCLSPMFVSRAIGMIGKGTQSLEEVAIFLAYPAVGVVLLMAGIWDFLHVEDPATISEMRQSLSDHKVSWKDFYASADPVPNGSLAEKAETPKSVAITNFASVLRDHNGYWENRDVFVTLVGNELLRFAALPDALRVPDARLDDLIVRRNRRVRALRTTWWIAAIGIATAFVRHRAEWLSLAGWAAYRIQSAFVKLFVAGEQQTLEPPGLPVWLQTFGLFGLVMLGYALMRGAWHGWNEAEMNRLRGAPAGGSDRIIFAAVFAVYLVMVAGVIVGRVPPSWVFLCGLAGGFLLVAFPWREDSAGGMTAAPAPMTQQVWTVMVGLFVKVCAVASAILVGFGLVDSVRTRLQPWVPRASTALSISAAIVAIVAAWVILALVFHRVVLLIARRRRA